MEMVEKQNGYAERMDPRDAYPRVRSGRFVFAPVKRIRFGRSAVVRSIRLGETVERFTIHVTGWNSNRTPEYGYRFVGRPTIR